MHRKLCPCGNADRFEVGGFGLDTCCVCGICIPGVISDMNQYVPADRIMHPCTYTRRKRFRRYLLRANRNQSCNTVPAETWAYLLESAPYTSPGTLYRRLKLAKHLKRKCYDSLPLMCLHLCSMPVPTLTDEEIRKAMRYFDTIDRYLMRNQMSMISYLFCLEFILLKLGRPDMLPFLNRIKCSKRRRVYNERLSTIFSSNSCTILNMLMNGTVYGKNPRET